ncbi:hypothetical protein, partial [Segatella buccae]
SCIKKKECAKNLTFDTPSWAELSFHGKGAEKKETLARSPCQCKDSEFSAPMQMRSEKTGQSARPCRLV